MMMMRMLSDFQFQIPKGALAYSTTTFGASMMNSVFTFYYVKVFTKRYHVPYEWFQVSQVIFMIWNAVNDPLFGYIQDNMRWTIVKSRRHSILYGAPIFAFSFIIPWFAWSYGNESPIICGLHLLFSLCFYDTLFTFVLLAQCALFTEMTTSLEDRLSFIRFSQVASLLGSLSVYFCETISNNLEYFDRFQVFIVLIAIAAFFCIRYTGRNAYTRYDLSQLGRDFTDEEKLSDFEPLRQPQSFFTVIKQIFSHTSFLSFVLINFCQIYRMTFLSNFSAIINDQLISNELITSHQRSLYYGALNFLPQVTVILGTPLIGFFGYYKVVRGSFIVSLLFSIVIYFFGRNSIMLIVIFFLFESISVNSIFSIFNLCLSDIIEKDQEIYKRQKPVSSMIFGTNALATKPAQSFAPMLTIAYLNLFGYSSSESRQTKEVTDIMFSFSCLTTIFICCIQIIFWTFYIIRDSDNIHKNIKCQKTDLNKTDFL